MKRLFTMLLALAGALAVTLVPAGPASAHPGVHGLTISGSIHITDDDWPDPDDFGSTRINGNLVLTASAPTATTSFIYCVDEVRALLHITASHNPSPFADWSVQITTRSFLFEGTAGCNNLSLDGSTMRNFNVQPYSSTTDQWTVTAPAGDRASFTVTVKNQSP